MVIVVIKGFVDCGLKVLEDVLVIGFDDMEVVRYVIFIFIIIVQFVEKIGECVVSLLIEQINGYMFVICEYVLFYEFIICDSVGFVNCM